MPDFRPPQSPWISPGNDVPIFVAEIALLLLLCIQRTTPVSIRQEAIETDRQPMKKRFPIAILAASCLGVIVACKPSESPKPDVSSEIAPVEEKIAQFKAEPTSANKDQVDKALADLNVKIKELEVREAQEKAARRKTKRLASSHLCARNTTSTSVDVTAVKAKAATGKALEKTGQAMEKAGEARQRGRRLGERFAQVHKQLRR